MDPNVVTKWKFQRDQARAHALVRDTHENQDISIR